MRIGRRIFVRWCQSAAGNDAASATSTATGGPTETVRSIVPQGRCTWRMNYMDVLRWFGGESYGIGLRVARGMWVRNGYQESYWTTTKVITGLRPRGRRVADKIYGRFTWKGKEDPKEKRIRGVAKRDWRVAPEMENLTLPFSMNDEDVIREIEMNKFHRVFDHPRAEEGNTVSPS